MKVFLSVQLQQSGDSLAMVDLAKEQIAEVESFQDALAVLSKVNRSMNTIKRGLAAEHAPEPVAGSQG